MATAILDRLLRHSTTSNIRGESYRLKERRKAGLFGGQASAPRRAGRGTGTLRPGRRLRWEPKTPFCNLHLSLMHRMGAKEESFGDSTGVLDRLS